jgi:hypothetical protein
MWSNPCDWKSDSCKMFTDYIMLIYIYVLHCTLSRSGFHTFSTYKLVSWPFPTLLLTKELCSESSRLKSQQLDFNWYFLSFLILCSVQFRHHLLWLYGIDCSNFSNTCAIWIILPTSNVLLPAFSVLMEFYKGIFWYKSQNSLSCPRAEARDSNCSLYPLFSPSSLPTLAHILLRLVFSLIWTDAIVEKTKYSFCRSRVVAP